MNQIPNIEELKTEFTKWHTAETTFAYGIPDDETIADWWLEKLHHQLQKAREEERFRLQKEILSCVTAEGDDCFFLRVAKDSPIFTQSELDQPINSIFKE